MEVFEILAASPISTQIPSPHHPPQKRLTAWIKLDYL